VQPTDPKSQVGLLRFGRGNAGAGRRVDREPGNQPQGLVETMKARIFRIAVSLGSVAAMAIAGGASLKGF
jgi:hypothetical protein